MVSWSLVFLLVGITDLTPPVYDRVLMVERAVQKRLLNHYEAATMDGSATSDVFEVESGR